MEKEEAEGIMNGKQEESIVSTVEKKRKGENVEKTKLNFSDMSGTGCGI